MMSEEAIKLSRQWDAGVIAWTQYYDKQKQPATRIGRIARRLGRMLFGEPEKPATVTVRVPKVPKTYAGRGVAELNSQPIGSAGYNTEALGQKESADSRVIGGVVTAAATNYHTQDGNSFLAVPTLEQLGAAEGPHLTTVIRGASYSEDGGLQQGMRYGNVPMLPSETGDFLPVGDTARQAYEIPPAQIRQQ